MCTVSTANTQASTAQTKTLWRSADFTESVCALHCTTATDNTSPREVVQFKGRAQAVSIVIQCWCQTGISARLKLHYKGGLFTTAAARGTVMAKWKMSDREVFFLSQTLERAEEEFHSTLMGYCSIADRPGRSSCCPGSQHRTELSAQDIVSVLLPEPLPGPFPWLH